MSFIRFPKLVRSFHLSSCLRSYESDVILKTPISDIRNIGIIAHIDAGKTTTTERLLYFSGLTNRIGNVDQGDTITDYMTQEKDRGITIQSAAVTIPWKNRKINIIDTPGHADFTFEVSRSLRVLDGAVTILDAVAGVEAQTEKVWKQAKDLGIPSLVYVNKMDRDGAGFGRTVKEVVSRLNTRVVLVNIPYFDENNQFRGILDILDKKLIVWNDENVGKDITVKEITEKEGKIYAELLRCREAMVETLGELDEAVIDNFLECDDYLKVDTSLLVKSIRKLTLTNEISPVLCGSSFKCVGVQPLLDAVVNFLPSPLDIKAPKVISSRKGIDVPSVVNSSGCLINNNKNLTTALAFKVINHPNRGLMIFVRVYSGKLQPGSTVINSRTGEKIKIGKLLIMNGDTPLEVKYLSAGNIGVVTGTEEVSTGDTLIAHAVTKNVSQIHKNDQVLKLLPIDIPPPVFSVSIEPTTVADKRKLDKALEILFKEDPSLKLSFDEESGQTILSGMGELHLEITKDRLVNDMKVNADIGDVSVTYKETILKDIDSIEKEENDFKVKLSIHSFEGELNDYINYIRSSKNFDIETDLHILDVNTGVIFDKDSAPEAIIKELEKDMWTFNVSYEKIINSILSGVTGSLQMGGRLARLPLQNLLIYIEKYEIPDIKEVTSVSDLVKVTRLGINEGLDSLKDTDYTLLEPIMKVNTFVLEADVGTVSQDLMSVRNGKISSIEDENEFNGDNINWSKEQMEKTYVPFDYTMQYIKENNGSNKMVIQCEAPLREMIGYLNKLRSLTKGRGIFDMELKGMERVNAERTKTILEN